jgi:hypothetical protein
LGNYNYSQGRSFLTGNEENPALVLSNVHNRTSARDGPMYGSMGPSMNTSSLVITNITRFVCSLARNIYFIYLSLLFGAEGYDSQWECTVITIHYNITPR